MTIHAMCNSSATGTFMGSQEVLGPNAQRNSEVGRQAACREDRYLVQIVGTVPRSYLRAIRQEKLQRGQLLSKYLCTRILCIHVFF